MRSKRWITGRGVTLGAASLALLAGAGLGVLTVSLLAGRGARPVPADLGAAIVVQGTPQPMGVPPWLVVKGRWQAGNGHASFSSPASGIQLAVLESVPRVEAAQVRLPAVGNGAGLVFAYQGPGDYWAVTAVPGYATWSVVKVVHGVSTGEGNLGLDSLAGGSILEVVMQGHSAALGLDGKVLRVVSDPGLSPGRVGVTVAGSGVAQTSFGDFQVVPAPVPVTSIPSSTATTTRATPSSGSSSPTSPVTSRPPPRTAKRR